MSSCFSEASIYYEKALTIYPEWDEARINLAVSQFNLNKIDTAYETIQKCQNKKDDRYLVVLKNIQKKLP